MIKVVLRDQSVEIPYSAATQSTADGSGVVVAVDAGYTEVLVDSDGEHHGVGFGQIMPYRDVQAVLERRFQQRRESDDSITHSIESSPPLTPGRKTRCDTIYQNLLCMGCGYRRRSSALSCAHSLRRRSACCLRHPQPMHWHW